MNANNNQNFASEETSNYEEGLSLKDVFGIIYKNLVAILIIIAVAVGSGLLIAINQKPTYTAKKDVIVTCSVTTGSTSEYNNYTLSIKVIPDIATIVVKNENILSRANQIYANTNGNSKIKVANVQIGSSEESVVVTFAYTDVSKELAETKLNAFYKACDEIVCASNGQGGSTFFPWEVDFQAMTEGATSIQTNSPKVKTVVIAGVIGVVVAALFVVIRTLMDDTVTSKEELERVTGVKLFAYIDEISADEMKDKKAKKTQNDSERGDK